MNNYVHTLSYNLVSETEKSVKLLYELNAKKDFHHVIVDLGFPLECDEVPTDLKESISNNTKRLKEMAKKYGSDYLRISNVGVSQNWTAVYKYYKLGRYDTLICCDPDERPMNENWVKAVGDVLRWNSKYGWVSLIMPEHINVLGKIQIKEVIASSHRVWEIEGGLNWAQGGFSGVFLNEADGVPFVQSHPIYGHIESASMEVMKKTNQTWGMLPDYMVDHTDYEKGSEGSSRILREWKNHIVFSGEKQKTLEKFLEDYE